MFILFRPTDAKWWHFRALSMAYHTGLAHHLSSSLALRSERQSARMSKIKDGGLEQYDAQRSEV